MNKKPQFKWDGNFIRFFELLIDIIIIMISIFIVHSIRTLGDDKYNITSIVELFFNLNLYFSIPHIVITNILYLMVSVLFFIMYKATVINKTYTQTMTSVIISIIFSTLTYILLNFFFDVKYLGVVTSAALFLVQLVLFGLYKYVAHRFLRKRTIKEVLVFGPKSDMEKYLVKFLNYLPENRILKYVVYESSIHLEKIYEYIDQVKMVYVLPNAEEVNKNKLITYCIANKEIDICLIPQLYEVGITNARLESIDDAMVYKINSLHLSMEERFFKRLLDIVLSVFFIIVTSWLMILIAIAMKIFDKGSVLYKQERVTINGKTFMLYKFRTMKVDAEKESGAIWSVKDDPRITKVGKILRKLRMDELPQFFNILNGDMSFVGPRPERPVFINKFLEDYPEFEYRLNVKAGLTGYAQIYGKYNTSPVDKLRYDLYYIRTYNIFSDIKILFLTFKTIFDKDSTRGVEDSENFEEVLKKFSKVKVIKLD